MADKGGLSAGNGMAESKTAESEGSSSQPAAEKPKEGNHVGVVLAVPQSTAIIRTPALCTATAKWKSKIGNKEGDKLSTGLTKDGGLEMESSNPHKISAVMEEDSLLTEMGSPSKQLNGSFNKMVRPSISITEAPQVGRPSSRLSGHASASSLSMLATESGKLLQAIPLATGGPSGQPQDNTVAELRINNLSLLAAIPYMPVGLAYLCLVLNIFIPGSGTLIAGFSIFCCKGVPQGTTKKDELMNSVCTNACVAIAQLFTITFLLVGWIWSVTWGVFMVEFAWEYRKYRRNEKKITTAKAVTKAFMGM